MHTAYHVASHSGQLLEFLLTIPVTRHCVTSTARTVVVFTTVSCNAVTIKVIVQAYFIFSNNVKSGMFEFFLTPFVTHVDFPAYKIILTTVAVFFLNR